MSKKAASPKYTRIFIIAAGVICVGLLLWATHVFGSDAWEEMIKGMPPALLIAALFVLPLTGFPLTVLLLAVGAHFGFARGIGIAAVGTAVHLLASYPLAGFVKKPVTALLKRADWPLPKIHGDAVWPFAFWVALVPGLSYALKNYVGPLAGVPFRVYFISYYPVHIATSVVGLMLGGATMNFSWKHMVVIAIYAGVLLFLTRTIATRLRKARGTRKVTPARVPTVTVG
jgi:uncharacterized membrane protein YdjX (TVP38/TMEM64 family)